MACAQLEVPETPAPETTEPIVRVALARDAAEIAVGGDGPLLVSGPQGGGLREIPGGTTAAVSAATGGLAIRIGSVRSPLGGVMEVRPREGTAGLRVNGRDYRGTLEVAPSGGGLLAVNLVPLEAYVAGVVSAELGRRPESDRQAVLAQAIVSRTVAVRALGRHRVRGYDVEASVADQVYGGLGAETALAWEAVEATHGQVITWAGAVIEAFFHSTCGGRTAAVEEVFSGGAQPYLRSIEDRSAGGEAYCALSPRFRWTEEWTGESLTLALAALREASGGAAPVSDVRVAARTPSGRVAHLGVVSSGVERALAGQNAIRRALRPAEIPMLRSASFAVQAGHEGGRLVRLTATGAGNGHGVGMCQWGAVGRARAGFSYRDILDAYFPGTDIRRFY